ncbi:MAG TPA: hypothetical protein VHF27_01455 [Acidimicrobiales bacterium]|nr:hypothetical protein [Acidimicrobiales bacterium]
MSESSPLGPGGRPFRGWRVVPLLLSLAAVAANAAILLSDRAPGLLGRLARRIDAGVDRAANAAGIDVPGRDVRVPRSDFDVHVAIWAVAALLVGLAMWSWLSLLVGNGLVLAASMVLELAQAGYSRTRSVEMADVAGNAVGVAVGTLAVGAFALFWRLFHPRPA